MRASSRRILLIITTLLLMLSSTWPVSADSKPHSIYTLDIDDMVTVGTAKYVKRVISTAEQNNAEAVIIKLNTPGGLVSATLTISQDMAASRVPVITYVAPQGAIAASAGTFILIGGNLAAMAPGTTCGAAMPVVMPAPGESSRQADEKTINFMAEHMRSIAQERGRPPDIAERFVKENLSLSYKEAHRQGVVDYIADNLEDLLKAVNGREVMVHGGMKQLNTLNAEIINIEMSSDEKFISLLSNPTLAIILLMLGIYGLIIGFSSPGFLLPEVLGGIGLILGLYGLGLFEVNVAAVLLILLGVGLLVAEAFTPTYGVLAIGGVASIVFGIMFFPVEPLMPIDWYAAFKTMAFGIGLVGAGFLLVMIMGIIRIRRLQTVHGDHEFKTGTGKVVKTLEPHGMVRIRGETWMAVSNDDSRIEEGELVDVVERRGMKLVVRRHPDDN